MPKQKPVNVIENDDKEIYEHDGDNDVYEEYEEGEEQSYEIWKLMLAPKHEEST